MTFFPNFVLEVWRRAGLVDVVPVRLNDRDHNYCGPLWFCSPFQRVASNSLVLSCSENVLHLVFITTVIFQRNHKVSSFWRTTACTSWLIHKSSVCPAPFFLSFLSLYFFLCLSSSLYPILSIFRG